SRLGHIDPKNFTEPPSTTWNVHSDDHGVQWRNIAFHDSRLDRAVNESYSSLAGDIPSLREWPLSFVTLAIDVRGGIRCSYRAELFFARWAWERLPQLQCNGHYRRGHRRLLSNLPGTRKRAGQLALTIMQMSMDHYARSAGAEVISVPLTATFAHDLDTMLARTGTSSTLVYICNPNNPTASLTPRNDIESFIGKLPGNSYVLIDEAYHHYAGQSAMYASFLDRSVENERVIVSRTFSKIYGLAGLRLGYGIASARTVKQMNAYATIDNVNGVVVRAGLA